MKLRNLCSINLPCCPMEHRKPKTQFVDVPKHLPMLKTRMLTHLLCTCFKKIEQYIIGRHANTNIHMLVQASTRRSKLCQSGINLFLSAVRQDFSCLLTFNPDIGFHGEYGVPVCVQPSGLFLFCQMSELFFPPPLGK